MHDELVVECPEEQAKEVLACVEEVMVALRLANLSGWLCWLKPRLPL